MLNPDPYHSSNLYHLSNKEVDLEDEKFRLMEIFYEREYHTFMGTTKVKHFDHFDHYLEWQEILECVKGIMDKMGFKLDWSEFAHTLRFCYLICKQNESINPHSDANVRHFASFNIPLTGPAKVSFFKDFPKNVYSLTDYRQWYDMSYEPEHIETVEYNNPILLNINKVHEVPKVETDKDRIVLKVFIFTHTFEQMVRSLEEEVRVFNDVPWRGKGKMREVLGEELLPEDPILRRV